MCYFVIHLHISSSPPPQNNATYINYMYYMRFLQNDLQLSNLFSLFNIFVLFLLNIIIYINIQRLKNAPKILGTWDPQAPFRECVCGSWDSRRLERERETGLCLNIRLLSWCWGRQHPYSGTANRNSSVIWKEPEWEWKGHMVTVLLYLHPWCWIKSLSTTISWPKVGLEVPHGPRSISESRSRLIKKGISSFLHYASVIVRL